MPQDLIRYDLIVQDALKGVVRKVLTDAASQGMPGEHHFYISFRTQDPGVRISQRLRDKYPDEMTIVLQHQFWDLVVTDHAFEVGLSFSGIPERLLVPFDSLTGFFDPSVQFGLKFEVSATDPADNDEGGPEGAEDEEEPAAPIPLATPQRKPSEPTRKTTAVEAAPKARSAETAKADKPEGESRKGGKAKAEAAKAEAAKAEAEAAGKAEPRSDGAEVVSLDAFRKKT
ncbi:MAG: ClpXP protease specificity-enhancing factor SspB [Alsobacter sp.]